MPEQGPRAKCDQVIFEALCKTAEVIIQSRSLSSSSGPTNARFNLQLPLIVPVREILERWKRALSIPIRIDVYINKENDQKELLERWCLNYTTKSVEYFVQKEGYHQGDPLVQLRHVCKRIVVWLRTLYSTARLLPATTLHNNVGFSIYAVESNDDVQNLLQQKFRFFQHPSTVISPYGEMTLSCVYAPMDTVRQFQHQPKVAFSEIPRVYSQTQSIPVKQTIEDPTTLSPLHAKSAPVKHYSESDYDTRQQQVAKSFKMGLTRRLTEMDRSPSIQQQQEEAPKRIMSGLSLAMMNNEHNNTTETRRAALHQPPPDYGYGYNNHIPWQRIHPSSSNAISLDPLLGTSPTPLASTPPTPILLRNNSSNLTPPFPSRSVGFDSMAPPPPPPPPIIEPKLEHLRSSPFHQSAVFSGSVMEASAVLSSLPLDSMEEMPFAIDLHQEQKSSDSVSLFAQKCMTSSRLKMFDSVQEEDDDDLAEQLAELKSFGQSIHYG